MQALVVSEVQTTSGDIMQQRLPAWRGLGSEESEMKDGDYQCTERRIFITSFLSRA